MSSCFDLPHGDGSFRLLHPLAAPFIVPILDKIQARIAVSARPDARPYSIGDDAWVIPNGVFVRDLQIDAPDPRFMECAASRRSLSSAGSTAARGLRARARIRNDSRQASGGTAPGGW